MSLPDDCREALSAFLVDEQGNEGPLTFSKFVPDSPEKFSGDVDGIVISHAQNKMDPAKPYTIKVVLGEGEDSVEFTKDVLPANAAPVPEQSPRAMGPKEVHIYGMDYRTGKWVPFPVDPDVLPGKVE